MNAPDTPFPQAAPLAPMPVVRPTNALAIASVVCSAASWVVAPFAAAIIGVVLGHMARKQIREGGGAEGGDELAVAGLVIGYLHLAFTFLLLVAIGLFFAVTLGALAISAPHAVGP